MPGPYRFTTHRDVAPIVSLELMGLLDIPKARTDQLTLRNIANSGVSFSTIWKLLASKIMEPEYKGLNSLINSGVTTFAINLLIGLEIASTLSTFDQNDDDCVCTLISID